jgi:hypothetical protein
VPRDGEGPRRLLDVESQSEPDPDILERAGEYGYRLRREKRYGPGQGGKYRVACLLLNLTGPVQAHELDMREAELGGAGFYLSVVQVTLREEDAAATLARIAAGELRLSVLPWIPLMRGADEPAIMGEWKRLALAEPEERRRADYGGLALVFAELAGRWVSWKKALEGWSMKQSQQVLEWQAEARKEGRIEGHKEGRIEGHKEGRKEGEVSRLRSVVLRALELRTHAPVPPDLAEAVAGLNDLDELARWFEATQTAESLDAFRAAVGLPAPPPANGAAGG